MKRKILKSFIFGVLGVKSTVISMQLLSDTLLNPISNIRISKKLENSINNILVNGENTPILLKNSKCFVLKCSICGNSLSEFHGKYACMNDGSIYTDNGEIERGDSIFGLQELKVQELNEEYEISLDSEDNRLKCQTKHEIKKLSSYVYIGDERALISFAYNCRKNGFRNKIVDLSSGNIEYPDLWKRFHIEKTDKRFVSSNISHKMVHYLNSEDLERFFKAETMVIGTSKKFMNNLDIKLDEIKDEIRYLDNNYLTFNYPKETDYKLETDLERNFNFTILGDNAKKNDLEMLLKEGKNVQIISQNLKIPDLIQAVIKNQEYNGRPYSIYTGKIHEINESDSSTQNKFSIIMKGNLNQRLEFDKILYYNRKSGGYYINQERNGIIFGSPFLRNDNTHSYYHGEFFNYEDPYSGGFSSSADYEDQAKIITKNMIEGSEFLFRNMKLTNIDPLSKIKVLGDPKPELFPVCYNKDSQNKFTTVKCNELTHKNDYLVAFFFNNVLTSALSKNLDKEILELRRNMEESKFYTKKNFDPNILTKFK